MNVEQIKALLDGTFGSATTVRARRPKLYQVEIPAFMPDGDVASIFVQERDDGSIEVSDLGQTCMRLSYTRTMTEGALSTLSRLAKKHGFAVEDDAIVAIVPKEELLAGAMGLVQVESEAEAAISAATTRGMKAEAFRSIVREVLREAFKDTCLIGYHAPEDKDGLYSIDARIQVASSLMFVAIAPSDLDAERAVSSKLYLKSTPTIATLAKRPRWVAVPRDANALEGRTRLRLMQEYLVPVPKYEDEPGALAPKLQELAA